LPVNRKPASGDKLLQLHLSGLRGGHSGIDIHEGRGNAVKILNRLLYRVNKEIPLELVTINGGDKHNAIPREIKAQVVIDGSKTAEFKTWFDKAMEEIRHEFSPVEKNITFSATELNESLPQVLDEKSQCFVCSYFCTSSWSVGNEPDYCRVGGNIKQCCRNKM
ncbi:MAG: aminoacyl-histidine dipeptidase, partial [Calditrichaeota bacterium]|nr:aminoacyl-histidine dipeptidase [Calditrichota bacterium]